MRHNAGVTDNPISACHCLGPAQLLLQKKAKAVGSDQ